MLLFVPTAYSPSSPIDEDVAPANLAKIPSGELSAMTAAWKKLSKARKVISKAKRTKEENENNESLLSKLGEGKERKINLGKSNAAAGVLCVATLRGEKEYVITGGHDATAVVYDVAAGKIAATLGGAGGDVTSVHGTVFEKEMLVVAGSADGSARAYSVPLVGDDEPTMLGEAKSAGAPVSVTIHPSSTSVADARILVASSEGTVELWKLGGDAGLELVTRLESEGARFSSGRMHPDGLIYIAGTTDGRLIVWDLKTQAVAGTLEVSSSRRRVDFPVGGWATKPAGRASKNNAPADPVVWRRDGTTVRPSERWNDTDRCSCALWKYQNDPKSMVATSEQKKATTVQRCIMRKPQELDLRRGGRYVELFVLSIPAVELVRPKRHIIHVDE